MAEDDHFVEDRLINYKKVYEQRRKKKNDQKCLGFFKPRTHLYSKSQKYVHVNSKIPKASRARRHRAIEEPVPPKRVSEKEVLNQSKGGYLSSNKELESRNCFYELCFHVL